MTAPFHFFRRPSLEPLPITMVGARMGERVLQIGIDDAALVAKLAAKAGMSGSATLVVTNEKEAARGRKGAANEGVTLDVRIVTPLRNLPFEDREFDLVVLHSMNGLLASMAPYTRVRCLEECHRVLREGGRVVVIEQEPRGGLGALIRTHPVDSYYASGGGSVGALRMEGFKPVRILADRDGFRFTEGLRPPSTPVPDGVSGHPD